MSKLLHPLVVPVAVGAAVLLFAGPALAGSPLADITPPGPGDLVYYGLRIGVIAVGVGVILWLLNSANVLGKRVTEQQRREQWQCDYEGLDAALWRPQPSSPPEPPVPATAIPRIPDLDDDE